MNYLKFIKDVSKWVYKSIIICQMTYFDLKLNIQCLELMPTGLVITGAVVPGVLLLVVQLSLGLGCHWFRCQSLV